MPEISENGEIDDKKRTTGVHLSEHDLLQFVVQREDTSPSHTAENVRTRTLEQRLGTLLRNNLSAVSAG